MQVSEAEHAERESEMELQAALEALSQAEKRFEDAERLVKKRRY